MIVISDLLWRLGGATGRVFRRRAFGRVRSDCAVARHRVCPMVLRSRRAREVLALPGLHSTGTCHPAGYAAPYLTVFSENSIDVFDVRKAEWVQTVPLKKVRVCQDSWGWTGAGRHGVTSVPAVSGATPEPRGLPVSLWHREDPPDLPQEPAGR